VLHHYRPRGDLVAVADIAEPERNEVASAKLAVDAQVEERELAHSVFHLKTNSKCPDVLESLNGAFWPTILPLFHGSR
jgi:hypothetical protein